MSNEAGAPGLAPDEAGVPPTGYMSPRVPTCAPPRLQLLRGLWTQAVLQEVSGKRYLLELTTNLCDVFTVPRGVYSIFIFRAVGPPVTELTSSTGKGSWHLYTVTGTAAEPCHHQEILPASPGCCDSMSATPEQSNAQNQHIIINLDLQRLGDPMAQ